MSLKTTLSDRIIDLSVLIDIKKSIVSLLDEICVEFNVIALNLSFEITYEIDKNKNRKLINQVVFTYQSNDLSLIKNKIRVHLEHKLSKKYSFEYNLENKYCKIYNIEILE